MKRTALIFVITLASCLPGSTATPRPRPADPAALDAVLKKMDAVAATFRTAQASFEWDTYQKVIDEVDEIQTGVVYYRRSGKDIEMMAEVKKVGNSLATQKPEPKFVLFKDGRVRLYQPKVDQVTDYDLGKSRTDIASYVVLGFGGSGQDLVKAFDVTYVGPETIEGVSTAKLQLVPKSETVRKTYNQIFLWIDLDKGISVQQQFMTPQGDYRLTKYSSIKVNDKISDDVFKLKTTGKTQTITPRG
jgi:outer membrane lipoprotein-sorting protein